MKLLAKSEAKASIKKDNEELIGTNIRLREMEKKALDRLNNAKANYDPEKTQALKDFEQFTADLNEKKSRLLSELRAYDKLIEDRKEIYYGLIEKQDVLEEKLYLMGEKNKKLDLREAFITDLEKKWRERQLKDN